MENKLAKSLFTIRSVLETIMENLKEDDGRVLIHLGRGDPSAIPCFRTSQVAEDAIFGAVFDLQSLMAMLLLLDFIQQGAHTHSSLRTSHFALRTTTQLAHRFTSQFALLRSSPSPVASSQSPLRSSRLAVAFAIAITIAIAMAEASTASTTRAPSKKKVTKSEV
ncbi:hypothetical protein RND71_015425 [Anisodus tanguticus]|uniref:Uncharacterized protein n=1 Tax=Anisodus tanguticus TaxID=243964 RepID=A0AAE1S734_9SOLA|nr:hypothetical protein RND71_015425 [Anisodus tanguticus]